MAIVEPAPSLTKSASPINVVGGQTVTYTLTAANAASASVLHDAWVVDCLPAGLTFDAYGTPPQGTTVTPTPGSGGALRRRHHPAGVERGRRRTRGRRPR